MESKELGRLTDAQRRLLASVRPNVSEATTDLERSIEYHHENYPYRYTPWRNSLGTISALGRRGIVAPSANWNGPAAVECGGVGWVILTPLGVSLVAPKTPPETAA